MHWIYLKYYVDFSAKASEDNDTNDEDDEEDDDDFEQGELLSW